ncbi:QsdR family transcriptional regulator [Aeromicrobium sp. CTD01-1L150]|uniref:QsdR family transcriptional regulator n=1 Tax=Aeromicrobium sp. CTD01-1L150 TaxID=3341830 RepID=UPI0035C0E30A
MPQKQGRADADQALRIARRTFIRGERVEMPALAESVGVSRVTLFRWFGNRDALLATINWTLAEPVLLSARERATGHGGARVAAVMSEFAAVVNAAPFFTAFLRREPERALRVLTTQAADFQARVIGWTSELLREEVAGGHLDPPLPIDDLAFLLVRITESFVYTDSITGNRADSDKVDAAVRALLR